MKCTKQDILEDTKGRKRYEHTCIDCGCVWDTTHDTKSKRCKKCAGVAAGMWLKKANTKIESEKVRYKRVCESCGKVDMLTVKRKTNFCGACNAKRVGKSNLGKRKNKEDCIKHFRICPDCPKDNNTVQVVKACNAGIKRCRGCSRKVMIKARKEARKVTGVKKPKIRHARNKVSQETIKAQQKLNREHKKAVEDDTKNKTTELSKEQSRKMIENFYKTHTVTCA
ncbi:MAG: hypothetical protein QM497_04775 [Sulfurimonas sp.]